VFAYLYLMPSNIHSISVYIPLEAQDALDQGTQPLQCSSWWWFNLKTGLNQNGSLERKHVEFSNICQIYEFIWSIWKMFQSLICNFCWKRSCQRHHQWKLMDIKILGIIKWVQIIYQPTIHNIGRSFCRLHYFCWK
jgi:hypothetical protein